jgi:hypothetical protein
MVSLLVLAACGGDDDDGGGTNVSTGLPKTSKLSSLDAGDAKQLCTSLASSFNGVLSDSDKKRITCTVLALPLSITQVNGKIAGDVPKCQQLVQKCMSGDKISEEDPAIDLDQKFISEDSCDEKQATESLASCDASVSEFESCASAMLTTFSAQYDIFDCKSLSDPEKLMMDATGGGLEIESLPECKALNSKCPDLDFGGGNDDSSDPSDFDDSEQP